MEIQECFAELKRRYRLHPLAAQALGISGRTYYGYRQNPDKIPLAVRRFIHILAGDIIPELENLRRPEVFGDTPPVLSEPPANTPDEAA